MGITLLYILQFFFVKTRRLNLIKILCFRDYCICYLDKFVPFLSTRYVYILNLKRGYVVCSFALEVGVRTAR
jgi:hypothetical protein